MVILAVRGVHRLGSSNAHMQWLNIDASYVTRIRTTARKKSQQRYKLSHNVGICELQTILVDCIESSKLSAMKNRQ